MELKGSKTEKNLQTAFAGESQARNKYTYFASKARKEGYVQIANIFEETANNEKEHAKLWFKLLQENGEIGTTADDQEVAIYYDDSGIRHFYPVGETPPADAGYTTVPAERIFDLNTVLRLPFSVIKLDRSLLFGLCENQAVAAFYENIVSILKQMGFTVIAEGVETQEEVRCLSSWGVDQIQGYYFSKPQPQEQLIKLLQMQTSDQGS